MSKANEYRFSLTLNPNDPLHRTAINALNAQGRRKSQFVVNAITHFIMEGGAQSQIQSLQPDREYIEQICREVVQEYLGRLETRIMARKPSEDEPIVSEGDLDLDCNVDMIEETLAGFRHR